MMAGGPEPWFRPRAAAVVQQAAALKTRVRTPLWQAEEEYEEDMRLPSAGGTGDGVHCCRCVVLGALFLCVLCCLLCGLDSAMTKVKTTRTRHATSPSGVPVVEGDAEGGGGGDLAKGPLDGQTNRGSSPPTTTSAAHGAYH